jgi:hypothetical protein
MRPTRRRLDDNRASDRITAALALIRQTDERWHGLAVWLSRAGMDRDSDFARPAGGTGKAGAVSGRGDSRQAAGALTPATESLPGSSPLPRV